MNSSAKYGAIATLCRSMYGHRLSIEDYQHISAMKSVPEVASFLKTCPGWKESVKSLPADVHRDALETALTAQLRNEYLRIYRFSSLDDKKFLIFPVYRMDCERILSAVRRAPVSATLEDLSAVPTVYLGLSKIDNAGLYTCKNYTEILAAVRKSIYYKAMRQLQISEKNGMPDYTELNSTLYGVYFSAVMKQVSKGYSGKYKKELSDFFGQELDMLNLMHTIRLRNSFKNSRGRLDKLMVRPFYKLNETFFESVFDAPDQGAMSRIIRATKYGKYFREEDRYPEQAYYRWMFEFNHHIMISGESSICIPVAYLALKELELTKLKTITECIRYGVPAISAPLTFSF